jgi:hypothetical protein
MSDDFESDLTESATALATRHQKFVELLTELFQPKDGFEDLLVSRVATTMDAVGIFSRAGAQAEVPATCEETEQDESLAELAAKGVS